MAKDKIFYDEFDELCVECGESDFNESSIPGVCKLCESELYSRSSSSGRMNSEYITSSS